MGAQASAPSSPGGEASAKKRGNPLSDFIETEKAYVELLTGIIRVRRKFLHNSWTTNRDYATESRFRVVTSESSSSGAGQDVPEYRERIQGEPGIACCACRRCLRKIFVALTPRMVCRNSRRSAPTLSP